MATLLAVPEWQWLVAVAGGLVTLLLCASLTLTTYSIEVNRVLRGEIAEMRSEAAKVADDTLPVLVQRLRNGASPDSALLEVEQPENDAYQRVLSTLAFEIGTGERMRAAAMAACANAAGRVQALSTSMLADLREMEERHDEEVLGDLLRLDHSTAQAGRLADSIAVLTGARSGRRWTKPIVMESLLRGAVGRISAYQRVQVHSASNAAIVGYAAEGVMHALAELMDNATSFSPPSELVHVYVEEVQAGIVVNVEDGGLVMGDQALRRAEKAVSAEPLDLTTLSGTRLGLAVVGCLARKHGLTISYRPSSRGGTGVVVMIPRNLVTEPRTNTPAPAPRRTEVTATSPTVPAAAPTPADPPEPVQPVQPVQHVRTAAEPATPEPATKQAESEEGAEPVWPAEPPELPRRRRGQTLAAARSNPPAEPKKSVTSSQEVAARFGAFRQAGQNKSTSGEGADPEAR
ncbi:ATP-binding protein [Parasphingorhabdus pacifica]